MSVKRETEDPRPQRKKDPFPWLPLLLLIGTVLIFWVLPYMRHNAGRVRVQFVNEGK